MKKLKYAVILLLGLSMATTMMTSCKKDNTQLIVGQWELMQDMPWGKDGGVIPAGTKYSFSAEGITTFPFGMGINYEVNGNILTLTIFNESTNCVIVELTNSTLKLRGENESNEDVFVLKRIN